MADVCFYMTHYPACKAYKFFYLAERLFQIGISSEIILCATESTGVINSDAKFLKTYTDRCFDLQVMRKKQVLRRVKKNRYKLFIVGTYSGDIGDIIQSAKNKGATTVELSTIGFNDPVEHDVDEYWLISKLALKAALNKRPGRAKKALKKKIHYVGSLMSDDIPNIYTTSLRSTKEFKQKYNIQNRYFIWLPGREDLVDFRFQKTLVKFLPKNSTLLLKPHPWSYKLHERQINMASKIMKVIPAEDAYWGLKGMECAIGRNSTAGIELAVMKKPILYIGKRSRRKFLHKFVKSVGPVCSAHEVNHYLSNMVSYDHEYKKFLNKVYPSPYKNSWQHIMERIKECIKTKE